MDLARAELELEQARVGLAYVLGEFPVSTGSVPAVLSTEEATRARERMDALDGVVEGTATTTPPSTPSESTPTESAPSESAPSESTPTESAPIESSPTESAPSEAEAEESPMTESPVPETETGADEVSP
jgi:hypothetical protein